MLNEHIFRLELKTKLIRAAALIFALALFAVLWTSNLSSATSRLLAEAPPVTVNAANAAVPLALSIAPAVVVGGNQATATITVSTAAPAGGVEITLRSLNSAVARFGGAFAAIGTSQLRIPEGSVSATFPVRTFGVANHTDVTLQAQSGSDVASATVTVNPASVRTLAIAPSKVVGGVSATGTVTLDGIAPASAGVTVPLSVVQLTAIKQIGLGLPINTPNTPAASVPVSVIVAPGAASATFVVTTNPVPADASVNVVAGHRPVVPGISDGTSNTITFGESATPSATAVLVVLAPVASTLSLNPASVPGGASLTGTVVLTGKAPAGGIMLGLSSSDSIVQLLGNAEQVTESSPLPLIIIPAGAERQDFQITTQAVGNPRTVTISVLARNNLKQIARDGSVRAVVPGSPAGTSNTIVIRGVTSVAVTANLSITPSLTVTAQPSPATAGAPVAITLMVQPDRAGSSSVALTTDNPELLQVPPTVAVPASTSLQRVIVNAPTKATTAEHSVTITASRGSVSASTTLLIKQTPPPLASFTLRPTTVTGGSNIIAQIALTSTAPDPLIVNLSTDHPELVTLPATVTVVRRVPSSPTFKTSPTTVPTTVTITASTGTQTISATVSVVP